MHFLHFYNFENARKCINSVHVFFFNFLALICLLNFFRYYCLLDSILLAEIINRFRNDFFDWCGLDCVKYIGLPGLSYSFFLKMTGEKIGLITDREQFHFVESGIKGQLSITAALLCVLKLCFKLCG